MITNQQCGVQVSHLTGDYKLLSSTIDVPRLYYKREEDQIIMPCTARNNVHKVTRH